MTRARAKQASLVISSNNKVNGTDDEPEGDQGSQIIEPPSKNEYLGKTSNIVNLSIDDDDDNNEEVHSNGLDNIRRPFSNAFFIPK